MAAPNLVVVESPAKAKTINKYLGDQFDVVASYGHVRDLPPKDGSVDPDQDFSMRWDVDAQSKKRIDEVAKRLKGAKRLYLATDPDREGEAISWHIQEELARRKALNGVEVSRVVFNEITKNAVLGAMEKPRRLNDELIEAYLARRALDYLVGFTLSPVLWRKLPGAKSAGRVQSVALRLICEREAEIEAFRAREYWSIDATMASVEGRQFPAKLTHLDGEKLDKFSLGTEGAATRAVEAVRAGAYSVAKVERKQTKRNPAPPFTTSTLQQEASRKLYFGATKTMTLAQKLYEGVDIGGETVGLITYMRTDSTILSNDALTAARNLISDDYGPDYLPAGPRQYRTKAKNAQEAHEAVRPTDLFRRPEQVRRYIDGDMLKLYELIWKRTMASQMESAVLDNVAVDLADGSGKTVLRATGSVVRFDGFLTLYREDVDDPSEDSDEGRMLPPLEEGSAAKLIEAAPNQHFTQPPPRYSEASLVKKMEELGIGRPSTYASILKVLQDREYVRLDKRRFIPEDRGRLVVAFLTSFFERYFSYDFTAALGGAARRGVRRTSRLEAGAARLLGGLLEDLRGDDGPVADRGARDHRSRARPPFLRAGRERLDRGGAGLPGLFKRAPQSQFREVRRVHRLLELSRLQIHPRHRHGGQRRRRDRPGGRRIPARSGL
jgi:DNA topoisomerase-1